MRIRGSLVVSTVVLIINIPGTIQPIAAAPAEPYRTAYCEQDGPFLIYETCYETHGVIKESESASGVTTVVINGSTDYTVTRRGEYWLSSGFDQHVTYVFKDGEPQVGHSSQRGYIEEGTRTCTYDLHTQVANGEVRHEMTNLECSDSAVAVIVSAG